MDQIDRVADLRDEVDCMSARNTLEQKVISENTGFLGGHWPAGALS